MNRMKEQDSAFNPFNHGTSTIRYQEMSIEVLMALLPILEAGWAFHEFQEFEQMRIGNGKATEARYFRFLLKGKWYFLKQNRPDSKRQQVIDDTEIYCHEQGIPTREIIVTKTGGTHYVDNKTGSTYSISRFIAGENFDGSRLELYEVARDLALLHHALATLPFKDEVDASKEPLLHHNHELLYQLLERFGDIRFERIAKTLSLQPNEIREISEQVRHLLPTDLETQIIHHDFHPHNVLFDSALGKLLAITDFEQIITSQLLRDVAMPMHRFSRTYGVLTERKQDIGSQIKVRAGHFLNTYNAIRPQPLKETAHLVPMLQDECLDRVTIVLAKLLEKPTQELVTELQKQVTLLKECTLFSF